MAFILWIFNIAYLFQHLGSFLQIKRIEKKRSIEGVCLDTQILFLIGALSRSIWVFDTMLKDFFVTYIELVLAFVSLVYTLYICLFKYNGVYPVIELINKPTIPIFIRWYFLFGISLLLSYFYFPGNEGQKFDVQMLVSLTIYTEASGLLPQIYSVNLEKDSNIFSSFYLMCLSISRILRLFFWIKMYFEEAGFIFLVLADVIHLFLVSGFIYSFFKNLDKMMLPTESRRENVEKKIF
jgi:ER lumen protein retaining receptor